MKKKDRVLVVEGDDSTRKFYAKILKTVPELRVEAARNGEEALTRIEKSVPDIIVSDLLLPGMDGLELCRYLKGNPNSELADIYLIVVSSTEAKEDKIRCMKDGADGYLHKPVDPDELLVSVKVGQRISSQLKKPELETRSMFQELDVLLLLDGGCAPGYNPVTAFITYNLEGMGRQVYGTREGFNSLVTGKDSDFVRLVYNPDLFKKLDHISGVFHAAPLSEWRGAQLRSERYRDFLEEEIQKRAADTIKRKKVKAIIAIGGDGTFKGIKNLCNFIPTSIQLFLCR